MPYKSRRYCSRSGCTTLIDAGQTYCAEHLREYNQSRREVVAHYDRRWRNISAAYLAKHPLCADCQKAGRLTPATETHHIIPVADGGSDNDANLMGLCKSCHSRRTMEANRHG
ncbi:HNH endonuclease [Clostridia bacterium]|nr:HNH endonuclease [Clostridia bacterium]